MKESVKESAKKHVKKNMMMMKTRQNNKLSFEEYSTKAYMTSLYNSEIASALGMSEEAGELVEKILNNDSDEAIKYEFGDVLWYINLCCIDSNLFNFSGFVNERVRNFTQSSYDLNSLCQDLLLKSTHVSGSYKKLLRGDSQDINRAKLEKALTNYTDSLLSLITFFEFDINEVMFMNIEKLTKRKKEGKIKGDGDNR